MSRPEEAVGGGELRQLRGGAAACLCWFQLQLPHHDARWTCPRSAAGTLPSLNACCPVAAGSGCW